MASNWAGLTTILAASNIASAVAKPIAPRDGLSPKVEIDYANITGRINGNIKEFLGAFRIPKFAHKSAIRCATNIYKASPLPRLVVSSTHSSTLSS